MAVNIPEWISENCIQCCQCSFVCPHAAIRLSLIHILNEEKPFEGENPFRKLDKKRFLSHDEKKKAKSLKKNGLISNNDGEASSFYAEFVSPQDEGETRAFLNAVSGVTKLGAPANAKRENRPSVTSLDLSLIHI